MNREKEGPDLLILPLSPHGGIAGDQRDLARLLRERVSRLRLGVANTIDEARELIGRHRHVVGPDLEEGLLRRASQLRWFQVSYAGVDHLDLKALARRNVIVTTASGIHATPAAEQVLGYMIAFERNLLRGWRLKQRKEWNQYPGGELCGGTLLVVGLGAIGSRVVELAAAFGMRVLGIKRKPGGSQQPIQVYPSAALEKLLPQADYIVLTCPLTEETYHIVGEREFERCKSSAVLVNIARGEVVDTKALIEALQEGRLAGAALDVAEGEPLDPDHPLWDMDNVILTPHMAGATPLYLERLADLIVENMRRIREGGYVHLRNEYG